MGNPAIAAPSGTDVKLLAMEGAFIALVDAKGTVVGWAGGTDTVLGHSVEDVIGQPVAAVLAEGEDCERLTTAMQPSRGAGGWLGIVTARHRDGHPCRLGICVWPVSGAIGAAQLLAAVEVGQRPWWEVSLPALQRFFDDSPVGISVTDPYLRNVWINATLERIIGIPQARRAGKLLSEVTELPSSVTLPIEARMRQVLESGAPVLDYQYVFKSPAHPGHDHAYSASFFRLEDAFGQTLGICTMVLDVNDRWRARNRLALLNEAAGRTSRTLDATDAAQALAEISAAQFADRAAVDLLDPVPKADEEHVPRFEQLVMRRVGLQSAPDRCLGPVAPVGSLLEYGPTSPYTRCLAENVPYIGPGPDAQDDAWRAMRSQPPADDTFSPSVILIPIRTPRRPLGVATFTKRQQEPFEYDDLVTFEAIVGHVAVNIGNALRFAHERNIALTLQRELLPQDIPAGSALEIASRYVPADSSDGVGGDWFDVIPLSGARSALVVGDVVGHGIHAAASMGRYRTAVRTLASLDLAPDELLARLDDLIIGSERLSPSEVAQDLAGTGATCLVAIYDPVARTCTIARAGHPPPAVMAPDGSVRFPELPAGPPLGLGGLPFTSTEVEIEDGSVLALFTDGLIETRDRDAATGMSMLATVLSQHRQSLDSLGESILTTLVDASPDDDVAMLLARVRGLTPDCVATWSFPSDPQAVTRARSVAIDRLRAWQLDFLEFPVELTVSELVTNAIRYGSGPKVRLRLIRDVEVICEVSDDASTSPRLRHARTTDEGGRGLFLVAQLARRWGTRFTPEGKTVWAELQLPKI